MKQKKCLKNLNSIERLKERLSTYYFYPDLKKKYKYEWHLEQCRRYFEVLKLSQERLSHQKIAEQTGIPEGTISGWLRRNRKPFLLHIAGSIPDIRLKSGNKWLPLRLKKGGIPIKFIEAPTTIENYKDILFVLDQLEPLKNLYNTINIEDAFGYVIGFLISDSSKPRGGFVSTQCLVSLSRRYRWSLDIGNKLCLFLRTLGIKANRIKDTRSTKRSPNGEFRWISEKTPFITWIIRTCLGLKEGELTTYHKLHMDWILSTPGEFRKSLLQSICDGDGSAHNFWRVEISCNPNQEFIIKLLKTFHIKSRKNGDRVVIHNNSSLLRSSEIPIFKP